MVVSVREAMLIRRLGGIGGAASLFCGMRFTKAPGWFLLTFAAFCTGGGRGAECGARFGDISWSAGCWPDCLGRLFGGFGILGLIFPAFQSRRTDRASTLSPRLPRLITFLEGLVFPSAVLRLAVRAATRMKAGAEGSTKSRMLNIGGTEGGFRALFVPLAVLGLLCRLLVVVDDDCLREDWRPTVEEETDRPIIFVILGCLVF